MSYVLLLFHQGTLSFQSGSHVDLRILTNTTRNLALHRHEEEQIYYDIHLKSSLSHIWNLLGKTNREMEKQGNQNVVAP